MRVLFDTNVLVSYLLPAADPMRVMSQAMDLVFRGDVTLVLPEDLVAELERTLTSKPYLRDRIAPEHSVAFIVQLRTLSVVVSRLDTPVRAIVRDPADNYLLAAAVAGDADYLVTGDKDLLVLRDHLDRPRIVTTAEFVRELSKDG